jgi:hypothetical protein
LARVQGYRASLSNLLRLFSSLPFDAAALSQASEQVADCLKTPHPQAIARTLQVFIGQSLASDHWRLIANKLAGNVELLQAGVPIMWNTTISTTTPETAILYIWQVTPMFDAERKQLKYGFDLEVFNGTLAGHTFQWKTSQTMPKSIARRNGFSSMRGKYLFSDAVQLSGLYFQAGLLGRMGGMDPQVETLLESKNLQNYNRDHVLRLRCRVGVSCPRNLEVQCQHCAAGRDNCPAAVRARTLVRRDCVRCKKAGQPSDPGSADGMCIYCQDDINFGRVLSSGNTI